MTDEKTLDPTINVRNIIEESVTRLDDLRRVETKRIDEKIDANNVKYQIQFADSKEAVITAFTSQEKAISAALKNTEGAIVKNDANTDKRFDLLSEKIDGIGKTISTTAGAQGIYVTHSDLSIFGDKIQASFENALKPLALQINILTAAQNNQQGKEGVTDPAMAVLTKSVQDLVGTKSQGISTSWGILITSVSLIGGLIAIFFALSK